jgi:hypothetical protein
MSLNVRQYSRHGAYLGVLHPRHVTVILLLLVAAAAFGLHKTGAEVAARNSPDPLDAFCLPPAAEAVVSAADPADVDLVAKVPQIDPSLPVLDNPALAPIQVRRGQVIQFRVASDRDGGLAVHGLSSLIRLHRGQAIVRFRAIYAGRFPLHFHGLDSSHFEIAVLEVRN